MPTGADGRPSGDRQGPALAPRRRRFASTALSNRAGLPVQLHPWRSESISETPGIPGREPTPCQARGSHPGTNSTPAAGRRAPALVQEPASRQRSRVTSFWRNLRTRESGMLATSLLTIRPERKRASTWSWLCRRTTWDSERARLRRSRGCRIHPAKRRRRDRASRALQGGRWCRADARSFAKGGSGAIGGKERVLPGAHSPWWLFRSRGRCSRRTSCAGERQPVLSDSSRSVGRVGSRRGWCVPVELGCQPVGDGGGLTCVGHRLDLVEALLVADADAFVLAEVFFLGADDEPLEDAAGIGRVASTSSPPIIISATSLSRRYSDHATQQPTPSYRLVPVSTSGSWPAPRAWRRLPRAAIAQLAWLLRRVCGIIAGGE